MTTLSELAEQGRRAWNAMMMYNRIADSERMMKMNQVWNDYNTRIRDHEYDD